MNAKISAYIEQYQTVHDGEPWFGESLKTILDDITPEEAIARGPGKSNIIRLVWHCIKWRQSLIERLRGTPNYHARMEDPDNWLSFDDPKMRDWAGALDRFEAQFEEIIRLLEHQQDTLLDKEFQPGRTYQTLIEGVLQHDIYHFGQISMLKNMAP